jgi:tRNA pseudouridine55 synthase
LARDIALAAGSRAHLSALERTSISVFNLEDSVYNSEDRDSLFKSLRPLDRNFFEVLSLPCFLIDEKASKGFTNGRPLESLIKCEEFYLPPEANAGFAGVFGINAPDELLGVLEHRNGKWGYGHVFSGN